LKQTNSTSGSYTVQLKAASGSGATVTWAVGEKDWRIVYFDGVATNTGVYDTGFGAATAAAGSNTQIQYNNSDAFAGSANLTFDGSTLTVTGAAAVAGHITPGANDTYDLGAAGNVWRNIYTGDLHLSNEAKDEGNAVDGTKGNWTIQEGEEHLFILNNKSGKKYKFKLEEI
jgi:hypothetical protein